METNKAKEACFVIVNAKGKFLGSARFASDGRAARVRWVSDCSDCATYTDEEARQTVARLHLAGVECDMVQNGSLDAGWQNHLTASEHTLIFGK
jgi:hypothetical protein